MKTLFNQDWIYYVGDLAPRSNTDGWGGAKARAYSRGAAARKLDDSRWKKVTLPHDFVSEGEYTRKTAENKEMTAIPEMESIDSRLFAGGSLEGGVCWYRKHFILPEDEKRVLLHFDGIYRDSTIYINEYYVESHSSGYTPFVVDITDFVNFGEENLIAVRVNSTGREGWWYEGGGIYRNVWLDVREDVYIEPWGVRVDYSVDVEKRHAEIAVETELTSKALEDAEVRIEHIIYACGKSGQGEVKENTGEILGEVSATVTIESWNSGKFTQRLSMDNITLWDTENPYLYRIVTKVYRDNVLIDETGDNFGIRQITFDADKGIFLNGRNIKIKGLCCHQDHAAVGIASYRDVWEYRLKQMKSMGMNGFRSAHHAADEIVLNLCDELGILVMGETRRMSSARDDVEAIRTLVKKDRNHPSIFIWNIGNEEIFSQDRVETRRTTITLRKEIQKLDSRPITSAVVCWNGVERFTTAEKYEHVTQELDVMGFNYCKTAWEPYHQSRPTQPIIITEASANSSTRGCYETDESAGQYYIFDSGNESKCKSGKKAVKKDMAEAEWKQFAESDYLGGIFLWTGMDYRGEPTPLAYPSVYSHFGIFDYCGFEKDNYFYYKSWWQEEPVLHLLPHWTHPGKEGCELNVYCYSNLEEVELFVNGKSYGKKPMEKNWYLGWDKVLYEPGELKAVGYRKGEQVLEAKVETVNAPYTLKLTPVKEKVALRDGTAIFNVDVLDDKGRVVPYANNQVKVNVFGAGVLMGTGNGNPGDHDCEKLPVRCAFNGKLQVVVRPVEKGEIMLTVTAVGLRSNCSKIQVV